MRLITRVKLTGFVSLFCVVGLSAVPASAGSLPEAEQCADCHGADGVSVESDIPTIAGASSYVLEEYMFQYREDGRPCRESKFRSGDTDRAATDMCTIAKELGEDKISELAEHFSSLAFVAAAQEFDAAKAAVGTKVHKRNCEKCHTDGGSYADDDAGLLAGQWMPYLEEVFADYASGERGMIEEKMQEKVEALDAESITALLHYYASLQ